MSIHTPMSLPCPNVRYMHHPWRELRNLPHIDLRWHDGAPAGKTQWWSDGAVTISLDKRLGQAQRRCTLVHEIRHVLRGRPPLGEAARRREEREIDREAARLLIPIEDLADALVWTPYAHEAADVLWVDYGTLVARINHLEPGEWRVIEEAFARNEEAI